MRRCVNDYACGFVSDPQKIVYALWVKPCAWVLW
jgi:hypothetical protein